MAVRLAKVFLRPIIEYGIACFQLTAVTMRELDRIQQLALRLRIALSVRYEAAVEAVQILRGSLPMAHR
ncbi:hypothetical protein RI367_007785 [Sorochytrium milnesiophthora]